MNLGESTDASSAPWPMLFITYDGLTDPLGGSQILPYVRSIAAHPRSVHILSFEKLERYASGADALQAEFHAAGIGWTPLLFSRGSIGKVWDLGRMYLMALRLALQHKVKVVHCRGHLAAQVGALVKAITGALLLFDFRGLWVDERVDKGGWDLAKPRDRMAYRVFKWLERRLLRYSDQVVVLTHAVMPILESMGVQHTRMTVIPCCADFDHFKLPGVGIRGKARARLNLPEKGVVLGYLGSVGPMYMTEEVMRASEIAIESSAAIAVLYITPDVERIEELVRSRNWDSRGIIYRVISARREEVPLCLAAVDALISFVLPTFARISMSPTKIAECFAQGIPVITNPGVGDVEQLLSELEAGAIVDPSSQSSMIEIFANFEDILTLGGARLREAARPQLGLEHAAAQYRNVYRKLEMQGC